MDVALQGLGVLFLMLLFIGAFLLFAHFTCLVSLYRRRVDELWEDHEKRR